MLHYCSTLERESCGRRAARCSFNNGGDRHHCQHRGDTDGSQGERSDLCRFKGYLPLGNTGQTCAIRSFCVNQTAEILFSLLEVGRVPPWSSAGLQFVDFK